MFSRRLLQVHLNKLRSFTLKHTSPSPTVSKGVVNPVEVIDDQFKIGQVYHGFNLKSIEHIPEFRMTALTFTHNKTGAEYLHLERDDSNNVFSISFRTTPLDSSGAPHILEHTVLCGSKLYPIRDPFFKMLNRSLATFMNAMTGPDYTFYPFSTMNETDFRNLQKIYLDAVFQPNLKELDFMQEGWRFENVDPQDMNSELIIKGVVYTEMKGALAENEHIMMYKTLNALLPDHTYGHISGGNPLNIPSLTWNKLKEFHKNHYHPSNAKFYSYGNFALMPSLEYINNEYLSKYDKIDVKHTVVPTQKRWQKPQKISITARLENLGQTIEKQNTISIAILMTDIKNVFDTFVLQFLTELLVKGPNSPFHKSLVEPKISGGFTPSTGFDHQTRDSIFTLGIQGLKKELFPEIVSIFEKTVDDILANGFEKNHIESVLHHYELGIKHQSSNFGLHVLFGLIPIWNHDGDVLRTLKINSLLQELKEKINSDPKFLQGYVQKFIKDNSHKLLVTMTPDPDYSKKAEEMEAAMIKENINKLTEKDKKDVYVKCLELQKQQKSEHTMSILPTLKMGDIKSDVPHYDLEKTFIGSVPTQMCRVNTNGVTYFRGILSTAELTPEQNMLLPLFCYVIDKLGTNKLNHLEFDSLVNRKTAGLNFSIHVGESIHQLHTYEPGIEIFSYALDKNVNDMWELWSQIFELHNLRDFKRFEMLTQLYYANLTHGVVESGHTYAMSAAASLVSGSSFQRDQLTGLQHIAHMKNLVNISNYKAILDEMSRIARILFVKQKLRCAMNVSKENADEVAKSYEKFIKNLPGITIEKPSINRYITPKVWAPLDSVHCQHHILNVPVYFCSKAILTIPYTNPNYAKLRVLAKLLTTKYLFTELRERQGAYGGGARLSADGVFSFFSYRDPRHLPTLDIFDKSIEWIQNDLSKCTDQDLLEAKLGVFQQVDAPVAPYFQGIREFSVGLTPDILQQHRANIMAVNLKDLAEMGEKYFSQKVNVLEGKVILGPTNKDFKTSNRKSELWTVMNANDRA